MRRFPVLKQGTRAEMPKSIPWIFIEQFRDQAFKNHGQTLERLAERGGLAPEEIYRIAHGYGCFAKIDEAKAIEWLILETAGR